MPQRTDKGADHQQMREQIRLPNPAHSSADEADQRHQIRSCGRAGGGHRGGVPMSENELFSMTQPPL